MSQPGGIVLPRSVNLRIRLIAAFIYRFLDNMILPFMTIYLVTKFGAATGGFLVVVLAVACAVAAVIGGPACDRLGRRPILVVGEFGASLSFLSAALATSSVMHSPVFAYVSFFIAATLSSLVLPAHDATIVDITDPAGRQSYYVLNYWSVNVGIGAGALLGGLLYTSYFPLVLTAAGIVLGSLGTVTALLLRETLPCQVRRQARRYGVGLRGALRHSVSAYRLVLADLQYMSLICAATLAISIEFQLTNYIAVRLARQFSRQPLLPGFGSITGPGVVGVLRLENTLLVVTLTLILAPLFRKLTDRFRLIGGLAIFTAGFVVLTVTYTAWVLVAAIAVLTVGELLNVPVKQALMVNSVRDGARGTYLATYGLTGNLGWVIASLCIPLGTVLRPEGMATLYAVCGVVAATIFGRRLSALTVSPAVGAPEPSRKPI